MKDVRGWIVLYYVVFIGFDWILEEFLMDEWVDVNIRIEVCGKMECGLMFLYLVILYNCVSSVEVFF